MTTKITGLLLLTPVVLLAISSGAPPRRTGAPGDPSTCATIGCHVGNPVNSGGGSVQVTATEGSNYTPGQRQKLTVTVTHPAARGFGFQASARLGSNLAGGQAGTLHPTNSETQVFCEDDGQPPCRATAPVQFITHTSPKTVNTFEFDWTPPADASAGPVTIYVAGNAVNLNGQPSGDQVYTGTLSLTPAAVSGNRPAIQASDGVVNGATFQPGIVSGSWATIRGENLAQTTRIWSGSDFNNGQAPTVLDGVRVSIDGKPAAIYYISPGQINVQTPITDKLGPVTVEVTNANGTSNTASGEVRRAAPGWFLFEPEGRKYIAGAFNDGTYLGKPGLFGSNATTRPAAPGDVIVLFGANFGPTNPPLPEGRESSGLSPLVETPTVRVGGMPAVVQYGGGAPGQIGSYQFNLVVPNLPNGDYEVVAEIGGVRTQANAMITVQQR